MAIDIPVLPDVAAIIAPQEIGKKRRGGKTTAIVVGTVLVLSDGTECVVTAFDAAGRPLCQPVTQ